MWCCTWICKLLSKLLLPKKLLNSLKRKAFLILFDDLKMTLTFKFFVHVLKVSVSCFLLWNKIFSKNSKQIKIHFLSRTESNILRVKNFWWNYQWKRVEKNFFAILTLNIELHCETYCNQHIYWMLGLEECELSLSCTLKVKNCYSSYKLH